MARVSSLPHLCCITWPLSGLYWAGMIKHHSPSAQGKWFIRPEKSRQHRKIWHSQMHFWQQNFWTKYFFFLGYDDVYHAEGHTEVEVSVKQIWKKVSQNLDDGNMPRFFSTLKIFTEVATLVAPGGFSLIVGLHVVHTKIIVWPSQIFLVFFKKFQHDKKYCVNEQWPKK